MSGLLIKQWLKEKKHTHNVYGAKCDRNGYIPCILGYEDGCCTYCARYGDTARHEVFGGADRDTSKALGLWLPLCPECHNRFHSCSEINDSYKEKCQRAFERLYSHQDFMNLIGKNHL